MKKHALISSLALVFLTGCASTYQKPDLADGGYRSFANDWVILERCGVSGKMDAGLTAFAQKRMVQHLNTYSYDQGRMKEAITSMSDSRSQVSSELCNSAAIRFEGIRQTAQRSEQSQPTNQVRTTNCSTYFGQTFCQTY